MGKEKKSLYTANQEVLNHGATYEDFPIGSKVKVVCLGQDFHFFNGDTGVIEENTGGYLGLKVKFDKPRHYEGDWIMYDFGFNPEDLVRLDEVKLKKGYKLGKRARTAIAKKPWSLR